MKMLYRYPQAAFPYQKLVEENGRRTRNDPEYELLDTSALDDDRFFDVDDECARAEPDDLLIRITTRNREPAEASYHLLPTIWFRNTWSWGFGAGPMNDVREMPTITIADHPGAASFKLSHPAAGSYHLYAEGSPRLISFQQWDQYAASF